MTILSWHFENMTNWASRVVGGSDVEYVKVVNPGEGNPFPGKKVIGRIYLPQDEEGRYLDNGKLGAGLYFEKCQAAYNRAPYVHAWEAINEPVLETPARQALYVDFMAVWTQLMHAAGRKTVALSLSAGHIHEEEMYRFLPLFMFSDYWGLHEYDAPYIGAHPEWRLRHRLWAKRMAARGLAKLPPLVIGECGIDLGMIKGKEGGWQKAGLSLEQYVAQMCAYEAELRQDPYVKAAFLFTAGASRKWKKLGFAMEEKESQKLWAALKAVAPVIPVPEPEPLPPKPEPEPTGEGPLAFLGAPFPVQAEKSRWFIEEAIRRLEGNDTASAAAILRDVVTLSYKMEANAKAGSVSMKSTKLGIVAWLIQRVKEALY